MTALQPTMYNSKETLLYLVIVELGILISFDVFANKTVGLSGTHSYYKIKESGHFCAGRYNAICKPHDIHNS